MQAVSNDILAVVTSTRCDLALHLVYSQPYTVPLLACLLYRLTREQEHGVSIFTLAFVRDIISSNACLEWAWLA